jgi:hypothetical protein
VAGSSEQLAQLVLAEDEDRASRPRALAVLTRMQL